MNRAQSSNGRSTQYARTVGKCKQSDESCENKKEILDTKNFIRNGECLEVINRTDMTEEGREGKGREQ